MSWVNIVAQTEREPVQEKQIWAIKPTSTKVLADKVDGEWFSMRPPKQYRRVELDTTAYKEAGINVAAWSKDSGFSIKPSISVMSLPPSTVQANNDKEFFEGLLKSLTARWPETIGKGIKKGIGMDALPIAWSLKRQAKKVKLWELLTLSSHEQAHLLFQQFIRIIHLKNAKPSSWLSKRCCLVNVTSNLVFANSF